MVNTAATSTRPVALVTGATGGMGGAIVRELTATHDVIALGRNQAALEALAAETGATTWQLDITDYAAVAERVATLPRLDVLVQAAAISNRHSVDTAEPQHWDEIFAVNVTGPAELTRAALPLLRASEGTVIFIGSGAGTRPVPGNATYTASKHALRAVADVLRIDEEPHRVRIVTLAPGQTDTELLRSLIPADAYTPERYIQPSSVAHTVRFVVDAPADVHIADIAVRPRQEIARI